MGVTWIYFAQREARLNSSQKNFPHRFYLINTKSFRQLASSSHSRNLLAAALGGRREFCTSQVPETDVCNLHGGVCNLREVELLHWLVTAVGLRDCHWRAMKHLSLKKGSLEHQRRERRIRVKWEMLSAKVPTDLVRIWFLFSRAAIHLQKKASSESLSAM